MSGGFNYKENNTDNKIYSYERKIKLTSEDEKTQNLYNRILSVFDENNNNLLDANELQTIWNNIVHTDEYTDKNSDGIFSKEELQKLVDKNPIFKKIKVSADELIKFLNTIDKTISQSFNKSFNNTSNNLTNKLKSKYPQNKFEIISASANLIEVYDKKTNKIVMRCNIFGNGNYNFTYIENNQPNRVEDYYNSYCAVV